jgi:hypothetical protein
MILKNVSARGHHVKGILLAPSATIEIDEGPGRALIAATRGKNCRPETGELVEGDPPMPAVKARGLADLPEDEALALVGRADVGSLDSLAEGEKRPPVLSAILKRKR